MQSTESTASEELDTDLRLRFPKLTGLSAELAVVIAMATNFGIYGLGTQFRMRYLPAWTANLAGCTLPTNVADNAAGAPSVTRRLSLQLFIITTAAVTAITFVGNLIGLRDIMRMSSAAVATLSIRTKSDQGQKRVSWFGRGRVCNEDGT